MHSYFFTTVLGLDPLCYLRFSEFSGTTFGDSSGNANAASASGTPGTNYLQRQAGLVAGDNDASLWLDGSAGYASIADNSSFHGNSFSVLVSFVSTAGGSESQILAAVDNSESGGRSWTLGLSGLGVYAGGILFFQIFSGDSTLTTINGSAQIAGDGAVHQVLATYQYVGSGTSIMTLYLDGALIAQSTAAVGPRQLPTDGITLGRRLYSGANAPFEGFIDEFAFFVSALIYADAVTLFDASQTFGGGDSPGVTQLIATIGTPATASVSSDIAQLQSALPSAAPASPGGLITIGAGTGQIQPNGNGAVPTTGASGSGALAVSVHIADSDSPITGAAVRISGAQAAGAINTDSSGNANFSLSAGTVTVTVSAPGYIGLSATHTLDTAGHWDDTNSAELSVTLTAAGASLSPGAGQTAAYLTTRDGQGEPVPDIVLTFTLVDPQADADSFDQSTFTAVSDNTGLLQVLLRKSTTYQARLTAGPWTTFTTGSAASFALPEILGNYTD